MKTTRTRIRLALLCALLSTGFAAAAQTDPSTTPQAAGSLDLSDRNFVQNAAQGGLAEIELGRMAQQRAANSQVKAFGERMVVDHGKANMELMSLISSKGVKLAAQPNHGHQMDAERLGKLSGTNFDLAYMKHMVEDHEKDVASFEKAASSAMDADVKAFAARTLPTLQAHLLQARTTYDTVRKQPAPNAKPQASR